MSLGDLDGDGDLDAFVTNSNQGNRVWLNEAPPRVTDVLVAGTSWTASFLDALEPEGAGGTRGHSIPDGPAQLVPLPWSGVNELILRFSKPVVIAQDDLVLRGTLGPNGFVDDETRYVFSDFRTETGPAGGFQAVWTIPGAFAHDHLLLSLAGVSTVVDLFGLPVDGEWTDQSSAFPSGDGAAGGDFAFGFEVAPADVDGDGASSIFDIRPLRDAQGSDAGQPGYLIVADLNGDGTVNDQDANALRATLGRALPDASPPQRASGQGGSFDYTITGNDRVVTTPQTGVATGSMDIVLDTDNGAPLDLYNYSFRTRIDGPGAGTNVLLTGGGEAVNAPAATIPGLLNASGSLDRLPREYYHATANFTTTPITMDDGAGLMRVAYLVQPGALGVYTLDIVTGRVIDTELIASFENEVVGFAVDAPRLIVTIPGDLNGDFTIGASDLQIILSRFTQTVPAGDLSQGDASGPGGVPDGVVGASDLQVVLANFTNSVTPPTARAGAQGGAIDALDVASWQGWSSSGMRDAVSSRAPVDTDDANDRISAWMSRLANRVLSP